MKYRKLGRTGLEISEIGMGLEHLLDKDESIVIDTIRTAVKGGINYFDCLPLSEYSENTGTNEGYVKLAKALDGLRDQVHITFLAFVNRPVSYAIADFECYLRTLNTGYADVFIIACCDNTVDYDVVTGAGSLLEYAKNLQDEGRIQHIGFSTHNTEIAHRVITSGEFDILMFPVNPAFDVIDDEGNFSSDILGNIWHAAYTYTTEGKSGRQPRKEVYDACMQNDIGLVAMKPFAGGFILEVEKEAGYTPVNLVSYALSQNGVSTIIPGCASPQEIEEILTYDASPDEARDYSQAILKSRWSLQGNCLYCSHCLPCSSDINIAEVNKLLNCYENNAFSDAGAIYDKYAALAVKASACIECGECGKRCPFQVKITEKMKRAADIFEK
jgi:predicted aldo/keto reductase-like oxidoreductase